MLAVQSANGAIASTRSALPSEIVYIAAQQAVSAQSVADAHRVWTYAVKLHHLEVVQV